MLELEMLEGWRRSILAELRRPILQENIQRIDPYFK